MNTQMQKFMEYFKYEGLTFDDVLLEPKYSNILPHNTSTKTKFSRNIELNIPFVSAAMDTVTESNMAIALANSGGIGVIHKNMSIERQALEVSKVKKYSNGLVENPIIFHKNDTIEHILKQKKENKYSFSTFPIVDDKNHFKGIIFNVDVKYCFNKNLKASDCMTRDIISGPCNLEMSDALEMMKKHKISTIPIVENEKLYGIYCYHDLINISSANQQAKNLDSKYRLVVAAAIGPYDYDRVKALLDVGVDALVIDTSHGHTESVIETVKTLKAMCTLDIIAGNIATSEAAQALINVGVDGLKVGIGPGAICTTRVVTGIGVPQLSAIYNVYMGTKGKVPIIADGGIKYSGDIAKALAAGADSIMMGSLLAGTDESPGEKIDRQGKRYVVYRGMGSLEAMQAGTGGRERYSQTNVDEEKLVPQGVEGLLNYRGSVHDSLHQFSGGLQFSLGYCGSPNIKDFKKKASFTRISLSSLKEGHPHQIQMTKDAPNYRSN